MSYFFVVIDSSIKLRIFYTTPERMIGAKGVIMRGYNGLLTSHLIDAFDGDAIMSATIDDLFVGDATVDVTDGVLTV